jgi:hypothetical protein
MTTTDEAMAVSTEPVDDATSTPAEEGGLVSLLSRRVVPGLLVVGILSLLTLKASWPLSNFDTYFHLRFGYEFLHGWSLRHPGEISTFGTAHWVPTQWLPEIIMAKMEAWFGLGGVAWFSGVQMLLYGATLYWAGRRFADPMVAAPLMAVAIVASNDVLSMRPQIVSFVLVSVTATLWLRWRPENRLPWILVPLTWFWATYHGMWPLGIVISLTAGVGWLIDHSVATGRIERRDLRVLLIPLLQIVVAGLTPVGPDLFKAVLLVNSRSQYFSEWAPPDFTQKTSLAVLLLFTLAVLPRLRTGNIPWQQGALIWLGLGFMVYSHRTVPAAAALLVPLAAIAVSGGRSQRVPRWEWAAIAGFCVAALTVLALVVGHTADKPPSQPSWVQGQLGGLPNGTPFYAEETWSGYLMWRYPNLDLVTHGYGDVFTDAELRRNQEIADVVPGWDVDLRKTGVTEALLAPTNRLAYALQAAGWTTVRSSSDAVLLAAPSDWLTEKSIAPVPKYYRHH